MARDKQHIVQKVRAELTIPSNERSREKSARLKRAVQHAIQRLEPVLDNMASNHLCRIDSLSVELTLPNFDFDRLEQLLEKKLSEKITEVLKSQSSGIEGNVQNNVEQVTPDQSFNEVLTNFLQTGRLPWWAESDVLVEAEHWVADLSAKDLISFIKPLMENNPGVIERLIKQFHESEVERIILKLLMYHFNSDEAFRLQREVLQFAKNKNIGDGVFRQMEADLFVRIIDGILSGIDQKKLTNELLAAALSGIFEFTGESQKKKKILEPLKQWLKNSYEPEADTWAEYVELLPDKQYLKDDDEIEHEIKPKIFNGDEDLTAVHSGIVLLHPFFEILFKNLGFIENRKFLNKPAQERAVCLLYFLATGLEEFPEHELLLPKFLCGWPIEVPISRFLSLTEAEKRECESVLSSCIQYWEALKNTSINGLRQNFLQRNGILKREEFGWSLYVEQKTMDLLLERLPWSSSVVKLKWMNEMLTVYWH